MFLNALLKLPSLAPEGGSIVQLLHFGGTSSPEGGSIVGVHAREGRGRQKRKSIGSRFS